MASLHFSISGDAYTTIIRDLVLEGHSDKAMRIVESGLPDLPIGEVRLIMLGQRKLVGVNVLHLEDDNDEEYIAQLNYTFAGAIYKEGEFWQPYARVSNWDVTDMRQDLYDVNRWAKPADHHLTVGISRGWHTSANRSIKYMDDQQNDMAVQLFHKDFGNTVVLWKIIKGPPTYYTCKQTWGEAFEEFVAAGGDLGAERGAHEYRGIESRFFAGDTIDDIDATAEPPSIPKIRLEPEVKELPDGRTIDTMLFDLAMSTGIMQADQVVGLFGSGPEKAEEGTPESCRRGWVSPEGKCYGCLYGEHVKLAMLILGPEDTSMDPMKVLLSKRWAKFYDKTNFAEKPSIVSKGHLTPQQQDAMEQWCLAFGFDFAEAYDQTVAE